MLSSIGTDFSQKPVLNVLLRTTLKVLGHGRLSTGITRLIVKAS